MKRRLTFLGTGTSTGVPQARCDCPTCRSNDSRDKRTRTSALLAHDDVSLLIDCGPDFRQQILRQDSPDIDALLVTHTHYDHLGGIDDLRPYCYREGGFPVYCRPSVAHDIHVRMPYCFGENRYPGAPVYDIHEIDDDPFEVKGLTIIPLPVMHSEKLRIDGFRIGDFCYVTDCKYMPQSTLERMEGCDILVINALRHKEHPSHMNLGEALNVIKTVGPRRAFLTHVSHHMGRFSEIAPVLPAGVELAYDGLTIDLD